MELTYTKRYVATRDVEIGLSLPSVIKEGTVVRLDDIGENLVGVITPPELPFTHPDSTYGGLTKALFFSAFKEY